MLTEPQWFVFPQHVVGEVYNIDDEMLKTLDKLERHPDHYQRHSVPVKFSQVDANATIVLPNNVVFAEGAVQECCGYVIKTYNEALLELPLEETFDDARHKYVRLDDRNMTAEEVAAVIWMEIHNQTYKCNKDVRPLW